MPQHLQGTPFNDVQQALAQALHEAGQTDRQIADTCTTSVNNIIWWRRENGLTENLSEEAKARAAEEAYSQPVRRVAPSRAGSAVASAAIAPPASAPRLISHQEAQAAFVAPVEPEGDNAIEIGLHMDAKAYIDLGELLTTRLLIQGNSGSGKTHLLRRILEECAGIVQQVIIDPEGDFASFGDAFGHTILEAKDKSPARLAVIATKARQLRGSIVMVLEGMEPDDQLAAVAAFLNALFDAGPEHWHPVLVAVDEAHHFAPQSDNGEDRDTRKACVQAMANLMSRGRKRGLAGIIATQRLSKLHKNVAAEASNYLLGRTFLDIDINRAADLLGLRGNDAEAIRRLKRGEFFGLGPAIARRLLHITVGSVMTEGKAGVEKGITPLPSMRPEDMQAALLAEDEADEPAETVVPFARRAS